MAIESKAENVESDVRIGVVGGGYIGRTVGGQFRDDGNARVVALVDIDG